MGTADDPKDTSTSPILLPYANVGRHAAKYGMQQTWSLTSWLQLWLGGIVCLGVACGFLVPNLNGYDGRDAEIMMAERLVGPRGELAQQIELYNLDVGRYPRTLMDLVEPPDDPQVAALWGGLYVKDADTLKDPWDYPLRYRSPGLHNTGSYDLWSVGPDGVVGTDDDIGNWRQK